MGRVREPEQERLRSALHLCITKNSSRIPPPPLAEHGSRQVQTGKSPSISAEWCRYAWPTGCAKSRSRNWERGALLRIDAVQAKGKKQLHRLPFPAWKAKMLAINCAPVAQRAVVNKPISLQVCQHVKQEPLSASAVVSSCRNYHAG